MTEGNKRTADDDNRIASEKPDSKFVSRGLFLFLDYLAISVGSWLYWIVISKFASVNEIGVATTVYSLVLLASFITQLGMEYPLLRRSKYDGGRALGVALLIEIMIATAALPIILIVTNIIFGGTIQDILWIGIVLLLLLSIEFVFRFFLLGSSGSKTVLVTDTIGLSIKFLSGYYLVSVGYGAYGILTAYLLEVICIVSIYFLIMNRRVSPRLSGLKYLLDFFKSALVNAPSKYSGQIIASLSVVMLASYGLDSSDVGLFYIALLISVFLGSFASSMAFMVIPASSHSNLDLSSESIRISLGLISPIVVILLVGPNLVLSLIGPQYEVANMLLFTLGIGILPYA
ncbi:MAG: hypothetical protein ACRD8Z_09575, partial [Nitrososphaeraceae archaeon]